MGLGKFIIYKDNKIKNNSLKICSVFVAFGDAESTLEAWLEQKVNGVD